MQLHYLTDQKVFVFLCPFEKKDVPKNAGFSWHPTAKVWFTKEITTAVKLKEFAADTARKLLLNENLLVPSFISPWHEPLHREPNNLSLLPFQKKSVLFGLNRTRSYLGLDPGLGKTVVAATIVRELFFKESGKIKCVYITPPFLVKNIENEFRKWCPEMPTDTLANNPRWYNEFDFTRTKILIVSDSLIIKDDVTSFIRKFIADGRYPLNESVLIQDEAHRAKNAGAARTFAVLGDKRKKGLVDFFSRLIFMSGTPMPNRPVELFPVLNKVVPELIDHMNYFQYGVKFCNGHKTRFAWDFTGASNMKELGERVTGGKYPFMLRLKKDQIDLPPKIEQIFLLSRDNPTEVASFDSLVKSRFGSQEKFVTKIMHEGQSYEVNLADLHLMSYRRMLGIEKAKASIQFIKSIMDETSESIIVFGHHIEAIRVLSEALEAYKPYVITGATPIKARLDLVNEYQKSPDRRLFIGSYHAMGVGFTLTKATRVIFVEFDWVPGVNEQASDRAHRIGQTGTVLVQYITFKGSVDQMVITALLEKRKNIGHL